MARLYLHSNVSLDYDQLEHIQQVEDVYGLPFGFHQSELLYGFVNSKTFMPRKDEDIHCRKIEVFHTSLPYTRHIYDKNH